MWMWIRDGDRYWFGRVGQTYADVFLRDVYAQRAVEVGIRTGLSVVEMDVLSGMIERFCDEDNGEKQGA